MSQNALNAVEKITVLVNLIALHVEHCLERKKLTRRLYSSVTFAWNISTSMENQGKNIYGATAVESYVDHAAFDTEGKRDLAHFAGNHAGW